MGKKISALAFTTAVVVDAMTGNVIAVHDNLPARANADGSYNPVEVIPAYSAPRRRLTPVHDINQLFEEGKPTCKSVTIQRLNALGMALRLDDAGDDAGQFGGKPVQPVTLNADNDHKNANEELDPEYNNIPEANRKSGETPEGFEYQQLDLNNEKIKIFLVGANSHASGTYTYEVDQETKLAAWTSANGTKVSIDCVN